MLDRKIKVAQFIGSIQDGGAETLVKDYALLLNPDLFETIVITRWKGEGSANYEVLKQSGVKMLTLYPNNKLVLKIFNRLCGNLYIPHKLLKILNRERVDVLHSHLRILHNIEPVAHELGNIRLFYTCHSLPELSIASKCMPAARKLIKQNNLRIIALHDEMREEINRLFNIDNTVVIRNGIDFKRYQSVAESKKEIRKALGIPEDAFVLGHIGRFAHVKNHSFLIDVFNAVQSERNDAFLLMVGTGPLQKEIEKKIASHNLQNRTLILSHRSDIPRLLKAMDVFVFPSRFEGLGIALIEAQVSGLRCVVSDKVPKEAFQTKLAIPMSLEATPEEWKKVIIDDSIEGPWEKNIDSYDMNKEIKRLEKLYMGETVIDG